jgi:hypothetical protein
MNPDDIDFAVVILGFASMFAICMAMMYAILLFGYAWPFKCRGYGWIESIKKAQGFLK